MTRLSRQLSLIIVFAVFSSAIYAQPPEGFGGPGGFGGRGGPGGFGGFGGPGGPRGFGPGNREDRKLVKKFDRDENGWLDQKERALAREEAKAEGNNRGGFGGPGGPRGRGGNRPAPEPGPSLSPDEVKLYPDAGMYDADVVRTIFMEFENEDWEKELEDFHGTDVEVPATLTVDGQKYPHVGIRFRGMSSYGMIPSGYKRSFNVSLDLADKDQRLYGYKTLNLLNCASDPSFMSTVLYSHIASQYIPVPKANHVRVVINGESWGVYTNVQQFDKEFLKENYPSSKGTRWKVSGNPGADGGLRYLGEELSEYKSRFDMKSNDGTKAWAALVRLCRTLNETPLDKLEKELEPLLDIDETLKFLALDVALVNSDGYWTRASDYYIFLDNDKKFHIIPHDMNEAFQGGRGPSRGPGGFGGPPPGMGGPGRFGPPGDFGPPRGPRPPEGENNRPEQRPPNQRPEDRGRGGFGRGGEEGGRPPRGRGGFGGFGGPGGPMFGGPGGPGGPGGHGGVELDPLVSVENPRMPLRSRLLALPHLREKYLAYVREIAEKSFAPDQVEPVIQKHAELIAQDVASDTRKLDTLEGFEQATNVKDPGEGSLLDFLKKRREFLLNYQAPEMK
ncbi:CotH kinase family protein [Bremerella cremea]|uniref:CotH kinase family protein n=1 Tax=Bremerella cremea TaxID=1031537 RepID=UPI001F4701BD|nr:CotH kinase family protein [Bremerella cremea]